MIFYALRKKLKEAKKSIVVCMDLFKTSKSIKNFANNIMNELIAAAKKGVIVEVLMEENDRSEDKLNTYSQSTATKLRKEGIEVRFDSKHIITHAKLIIIDERLVFIGSHNLTHTALGKSNETSLMVDSKELADVFLKYIHNQVSLLRSHLEEMVRQKNILASRLLRDYSRLGRESRQYSRLQVA